MLKRPCAPLALPFFLSAFVLTGCSTAFDAASDINSKTGPATITGSIYGGRQPIAGAQLYVLAASTTGYGGNGIAASSANASTSLLTAYNTGGFPTTQDGNGNYYVTSDSTGSFGLAGAYSCIPGTQVYLYSIGGDPGGGTNAGAGEMAILGNCPAGGNMSSVTPHVYMSEVSTVAAAYAMASFATDATHVGTTGSALAQIGIKNAFANAAQLVDVGAPPNPDIQQGTGARTTTPNGNGTVPTSEINTLANILAYCVNSGVPAGGHQFTTNCETLFGYAESAGDTGTSPTDTASAAINIAHFPYTANVSNLFNLVGGIGVPYLPVLNSAPADWTVAIRFTGGGLSSQVNQAHGLAIDGFGNVWSVTASGGTVLVKYSPLGVPANTSGYALNLGNPQSVAVNVDSSHVWITSPNSGKVTDFTVSGATAVDYTAGIASPYDIAIDASGNPWVTDMGTYTVLKLNASSGAVTATASSNGISGPVSVAIEPVTGNVWIANNDSVTAASVFTSSATAVGNYQTGASVGSFGIAIDSGGNPWIANLTNSVSKLPSSGASNTVYSVSNSSASMESVAIDGAGNVWVDSNSGAVNNTIFEFSSTGTLLSNPIGNAPNPITSPAALAVDGSGNLWLCNASPTSLRELIGIAAPVVTPIAYGVANNLLGTRP